MLWKGGHGFGVVQSELEWAFSLILGITLFLFRSIQYLVSFANFEKPVKGPPSNLTCPLTPLKANATTEQLASAPAADRLLLLAVWGSLCGTTPHPNIKRYQLIMKGHRVASHILIRKCLK